MWIEVYRIMIERELKCYSGFPLAQANQITYTALLSFKPVAELGGSTQNKILLRFRWLCAFGS